MRKTCSSFLISCFFFSSSLQAQPLGTTHNAGQTYYDLQNVGSIGRTIALDENGDLHLCWTATTENLVLKYNFYQNGFTWNHGTNVSSLETSSQGVINLLDNRRAVMALLTVSPGEQHCAVEIDRGAGIGSFQEFLIQNPAGGPLISPRIVIDNRGWFHILACTRPAFPSLKRALYYNRSEDMGYTWNGWILADSIRTVCPAMAVSASGKVAFAWTHPVQDELTSPVETVNNDVYYIISQDGGTPDFDSPINVTDFENALHPDADSLRAYEDISLVFDAEENLHLIYTCTGYIDVGSHHITTPGAKIYHYSENTGFTYIAGALSSGAIPIDGRRMYDRPSLGYRPSSGELFVIWNQFDDQSDTSCVGFVNGEVWGAFSDDGGANWSSPVNITATESPGANPGDCLSEDYPSLSSAIDDTLRIAYILDREPGVIIGDYPSDVIYQEVSIEEFKNAASIKINNDKNIVENFSIIDSYPNPFNPVTQIKISLQHPTDAEITVFNLRGERVALIHQGALPTGTHNIIWNASPLPSGIYLIRLEAGELCATHKIILLK